MHAYLITAYDSFNILKKGLELYDDERNDIYIHMDANTKNVDFRDIKSVCKKSNVSFVKSIPVRWGTSDVMKSEYILWEEASKRRKYDYYHLISGRDMPLWNQNKIHKFFNEQKGKNFLPIRNYPPLSDEFAFRYKHYVFWPHYMIKKGTPFVKCMTKISGGLEKAQTKFGMDRFRKAKFKVCKGGPYCSITDDFCRYVVKHKKWCMHWFGKLTMFPDELYLSTLIYNSKYRKTIYEPQKEEDSSLREIRWENTKMRPHVWTMDEYDFLISSPNIFARKFDEKHLDIVEAIYKYVKNGR